MSARKQLAFRIPPEILERLDDRAKEHGVTRTAVVEQALSGYLEAGEGPVSKAVSEQTSDQRTAVQAPAPPESLDLAGVLSERTGQPKSLCRMYVHRGRVTVNGEVEYRPEPPCEPGKAYSVELDGRPV